MYGDIVLVHIFIDSHDLDILSQVTLDVKKICFFFFFLFLGGGAGGREKGKDSHWKHVYVPKQLGCWLAGTANLPACIVSL